MFLPAITRSTRFSTTSSTLIDNKFINKPHNLLVSGILITDISDHLQIFYISSELSHKNSTKYLTKTIRMTSSEDIANLKNELSEIDWTLLERCQDPNAAYETFLNIFTDIYNKNVLISTKTVRCYDNHHKPWISNGIIKSIKFKNSLYKIYLCYRSPEAKLKFNTYKNKLTSTICFAEKTYYSNKFE